MASNFSVTMHNHFNYNQFRCKIGCFTNYKHTYVHTLSNNVQGHICMKASHCVILHSLERGHNTLITEGSNIDIIYLCNKKKYTMQMGSRLTPPPPPKLDNIKLDFDDSQE